jgi:hypothetical protein
MIDLAKVVKRIETRLAEMGVTAAEISAQATESKDTIRNWQRAVEADEKNGTTKASATTIKLNQIEKALGVVLARDVDGATSPEAQLRAALLAFGVDASDLGKAVGMVKGFLTAPDEQPPETPPGDRSGRASRRREEVPSR